VLLLKAVEQTANVGAPTGEQALSDRLFSGSPFLSEELNRLCVSIIPVSDWL